MANPDVDWLIPGHLRLERGPNNLPRLHVQTERAVAQIYLAGAHVTRFAPRVAAAEADPALNGVLFLSNSSHFAEGKAIRGGVPVIFPWFARATAGRVRRCMDLRGRVCGNSKRRG